MESSGTAHTCPEHNMRVSGSDCGLEQHMGSLPREPRTEAPDPFTFMTMNHAAPRPAPSLSDPGAHHPDATPTFSVLLTCQVQCQASVVVLSL